MSLSDVAGVFSRYFILGFFLPVFFALVVLWQLLTPEFVPDAFDEEYEGATAVAILAGAALPLGLVLLGVAYPVIRLLEGYFMLKAHAPAWRYYPLWPLSWLLLWRQRAAFARLTREKADPERRRGATWRLDLYYPPTREELLPTRLGNAVRAFELHSLKRYGLSSIGAWPRVDLLLSEQERTLLEDAQAEVWFFVNSSLAAVFVSVLLFADWVAFRSVAPEHFWWLAPLALGYLLYRGAVEAATRWGDVVRSCLDVHRLSLYEKLGLRLPTTNAEERELGTAVSRFFLFGSEIDDRFRAGGGREQAADVAEAPGEERRGEEMNPSSGLPRRPRRLGRLLVLSLVGLGAKTGASRRRARRLGAREPWLAEQQEERL